MELEKPSVMNSTLNGICEARKNFNAVIPSQSLQVCRDYDRFIVKLIVQYRNKTHTEILAIVFKDITLMMRDFKPNLTIL